MSTTKESGFEGPLPPSIRPGGFHCYRRGGCDREALCEGEGDCLGIDPPLANALNRNHLDELAENVRALTYAEMVEFAGGLWSLRGEGKMNCETLPKILHAWTRKVKLASDCAVEPRTKCQPIDTAPKDRPILAFMLGGWRIARWRPNYHRKRPMPFWSADDLRVTDSRAHQPKWWAELPPSPPEAEARSSAESRTGLGVAPSQPPKQPE